MKIKAILLKITFVILTFSSISQVHNRVLKLNVGYSGEQFSFSNTVDSFNDTSRVNQFNHKYALPAFSFSQEITLSQIFSISATVGYQYYNTKYNNSKYGSHNVFGTINPQLSVFYKRGFEMYLKLKFGMIYRNNRCTDLSLNTQRFLPEKTNLITGFSIGANYFMNNKWGVNTELSFWSPELINFGLTYRFFKGVMPTKEELEAYIVD